MWNLLTILQTTILGQDLRPSDFSGTLRDLRGNPVPKPGGGYWDHRTEMVQSHNALNRIKNSLEGSLRNPNLDNSTRQFLQSELNRANSYLNHIEELFRPFGGVR